MNALEIIDRVRNCDAELALKDGTLVVQERGEPLPEEIRQLLREHKAEVMVALGAPMDRTVDAVLNDIRPHLPPSLRRLPNEKLLVLVNWTIMAAWQKVLRNAEATAR